MSPLFGGPPDDACDVLQVLLETTDRLALTTRRARSVYLARSELEDGYRESEALQHLIEQVSLLPAGALLGAKGDQDVIGIELSDRVLEGEQGIICADGALRVDPDLFEVTQHRLEALVGLLLALVRCR